MSINNLNLVKKSQKLAVRFNILFREIYVIFFYILPYSILWFYRKNIITDIISFTLTIDLGKGITKKAYLFAHSSNVFYRNKEATAILLLHGDYGHPSNLLHLTDIAKKAEIGPVFSLYLPYNGLDPQVHRLFLKKAIKKIEEIIHIHGGKLYALIGGGHSKGAMVFAYNAFVEKNEIIKGVISIAGRLRASPPMDNELYIAIEKTPELILYQIVAGEDWTASLESTVVRPETCYIINHALHLNILYYKETSLNFFYFLRSFHNPKPLP